ncbi:hypothetical protein [Kitasatospora sp. NBC_01539]|uniref:hypothetical protein n=1 Tax=Kitasatospora sp. NBC_01539 TaxID=2903577 RepID=UPI0038603052
MARIRRVVLGAAVGGMLAGLTGCTVAVGAVSGVTVTADGRPIGMVMVCHHRIDGATLYTDQGTNGTRSVGRWKHDGPLTGYAPLPLDGGDGWTVEQPLQPLEAGRVYTLYGWTEDDSWSAGSVSFTLADLAALTPGRVRYFVGAEYGGDADGWTTTSLEEFQAHACDNVGS